MEKSIPHPTNTVFWGGGGGGGGGSGEGGAGGGITSVNKNDYLYFSVD